MTRCYRQGLRATKTAATRCRIIAAARECVLRSGYAAMRMEAVAATAGVTRASVFRHFATKALLLQAVEADAADRAGVYQLVDRLARLAPREALLAAMQGGCAIWSAEAAVFREFYQTAIGDDELRSLVATKEAARRDVVAGLVDRLARAGLLRPCWPDQAEVSAGIALLTGFLTYDTLTRELGLSSTDAAALLEKLVLRAFVLDGGGGDEPDHDSITREPRRV